MSEFEPSIIPGKRIVIEGNDGTGKTTTADMLAWQVGKNGYRYIRVDEPNSPIDDEGTVLLPRIAQLRELDIKNGSYAHNPHADLAMFNVARYVSWTHVTKPKLAEGWWDFQGRDDTSSGAYQGSGDGLGIQYVKERTREVMNDEAYFHPDFRTILVFKNEIERLKRLESRGAPELPDTFEKRGPEFQARVNDGYLMSALEYGIDITEIEAGQPKEEVADIVFEKMVGAVGINLVKYDWEEYRESNAA